ncbi:MAG: hypothetical protein NTX03_04850 [Bacteroidetes bacterium]|nr:hypothetical protein [Bacteroidota bacterium]
MKTLKLIGGLVLSAVLVIGSANHAAAQNGDGNEKGEKIKKELGLSDKQTNDIKTINKDYKSRVEGIRKDPNLDRAAKRDKIKDIRKEHKEKLRGVLTPEQRDKFREKRQNRKEDRGDDKRDRRPHGRRN